MADRHGAKFSSRNEPGSRARPISRSPVERPRCDCRGRLRAAVARGHELGDASSPSTRASAATDANLARPALDAATGRPAAAERRLRDNIGAGFALLEGTTVIENLGRGS